MLPTIRILEYNHSTYQEDSIILNKYLTLHKYSVFVQQYSRSTCQLNYKKSSRRLWLAQGLHNLIGHSRSLRQILTELIICTLSFGPLFKHVQASGWPIRFHQPKYVTYVLAGDGGDKPLKGSGHSAKPPSQRERFLSILLWDLHGLGYLQGGIPDLSQLHEFSMHRVS